MQLKTIDSFFGETIPNLFTIQISKRKVKGKCSTLRAPVTNYSLSRKRTEKVLHEHSLYNNVK